MELRPSEIYFTQNSIGSTFGRHTLHNRKSIGSSLDDLVNGTISISDIPKMSVMQENGKWLTADNRRLWIFRHLEKLNKCSKIPVNITYYIDSKKRTSTNGGTNVSIYRGRDPGGYSWQKVDSITISNFVPKNPTFIYESKKTEEKIITESIVHGVALQRANIKVKKETVVKKKGTNESKMTFVKRCGKWSIKDSFSNAKERRRDIMHGILKPGYRDKGRAMAMQINGMLFRSCVQTVTPIPYFMLFQKPKIMRGILKTRFPLLLQRMEPQKTKKVTFGGKQTFIYDQKVGHFYIDIEEDESMHVYMKYFFDDYTSFAIEPSEYMDFPEIYDCPNLDEWISYKSYIKKISDSMLRNWGKHNAITGKDDIGSSNYDSKSCVGKFKIKTICHEDFKEKNLNHLNTDSVLTELTENWDDNENMYCSSDSDESDGNDFMYYDQHADSESIDYEQWKDRYSDSDSESESVNNKNMGHDLETKVDKDIKKGSSGTRILNKIKMLTYKEFDSNVRDLKYKNEYDYSSEDFTDSEFEDDSHTTLLDKFYADGLYDSSDTENMVFDYLE